MNWLFESGYGAHGNPDVQALIDSIVAWQTRVVNERREVRSELAPTGRAKRIPYRTAVRRLEERGLRARNGSRSLHIHALSPGCIHCGEARGYSIEISKACNRSCFFCYDDREAVASGQASMEACKKSIQNANAVVPLESFAITGGEPLLAFETTVKTVAYVKTVTGGSCQVRVYTNGDLLDRKTLGRLRDSGLDELRIGVKPKSEDFRTIALAKEFIPRVLVEMPVMPDHGSYMEGVLTELAGLRIFGINLLEFLYNGHHPELYNEHGYSLKEESGKSFLEMIDGENHSFPVEGSEDVCLELLDFGIRKGLPLGIHYCSFRNKDWMYRKWRHRLAVKTRLPYHEVTSEGLLKTLAVLEPHWLKAYKVLMTNRIKEAEMAISEKRDRLVVHPAHMGLLKDNTFDMGYIYSMPWGEIVNVELL